LKKSDDWIFFQKSVLWSLDMRQIRFSRSLSKLFQVIPPRLIRQGSFIFMGTCPRHLIQFMGIISDPAFVLVILNRLYLGYRPRKPPDYELDPSSSVAQALSSYREPEYISSYNRRRLIKNTLRKLGFRSS
jgi:hypothetical protein